MHAVMFYFLFRNFYEETYKKKAKITAESMNKKESNVKTNSNGNSTKNEIYASQYKMATGYISDSGMRNRVFIDKHEVEQQ